MTKRLLYHYTDRLSAAEIIRDGYIRAQKLTLYKDVRGKASGSRGYETPPLVWLTINPVIESTVALKLIATGWPRGLVNDVWRFSLPHDYAPAGLAEFGDAHRIDPSWWEWVVRSGDLAGSHYTTWRLHPRHIPREDWLSVEVLSGYEEDAKPIWTDAPP